MTLSASPYSRAMCAFWHGDTNATYTIHRDDGFSQPVPVGASFAGPPFTPIEHLAMERCCGRVLDVGAGVGRHALCLQKRGLHVTAIEVEPELVAIMTERGVAAALGEDFFQLTGQQFETVLMLMNGFGMVGSLAGVDTFFEHARGLLHSGGQILCDSLDVRQTNNPVHLAYHEANRASGRPAGQMRFSIEYGGRRGDPFDWLHVDFDTLGKLARQHGWSAEKLAQEDNGHYLARLFYKDSQMA